MKDIFLVNYSVKGIKNLEELVSLSFYKKTISKDPDTQEYNVKGIYGMNGSGKSGLITSVDIFKNVLINSEYLNNPIVQKNLHEMINKKSQELFIEADFIAKVLDTILYFRYQLNLAQNQIGKFIISREAFYVRKANTREESMETIFEVENGELKYIADESSPFSEMMRQRTINLLSSASMCALFYEKILLTSARRNENNRNTVISKIGILFMLGSRLHVCLERPDDHRNYIIKNSLKYLNTREENNINLNALMSLAAGMNSQLLSVLKVSDNVVEKNIYKYFESDINRLYDFIHIFKSELKGIEIDKKEDRDVYICNLVMVYDSYKIHAEFESTGIKKLIRLYAYFREIVQGGIVFIDELDSNLHDVYLCALLEYLMEYAEGQLCFTTHNVGPMDILRRNKKSIDFLSTDGKTYSWTTNGNYSPSNLYKKGMIEGSPFNVDSIDFIGIFGSGEDD